MRLLLIRHGQTPGNVLGQLDTAHPGPGLTELGERQAEALARSLANEQIDALYASTLIRTQITAAPLARVHGLEIEVLAGLHEIEAGALEKLTDHESHMRYLGTVFSWAGGELDRRMPAGPDGQDFFERYDAAIARIAARGKRSGQLRDRGRGQPRRSHPRVGRPAGRQHRTRLRGPARAGQHRHRGAGRGSRRRLASSSTGTTAPWAAWPWRTPRRKTPRAARPAGLTGDGTPRPPTGTGLHPGTKP